MIAILSFCSLLMFNCAAFGNGDESADETKISLAGLRLIGEKIVPHDFEFQGTLVGGLSGLARADDGSWHALSDDRSHHHPARMYALAADYDTGGFHTLSFSGVTMLQRHDGSHFPSGDYVDPEAIRFDAVTGTLLWTSEGDRKMLVRPFLREMRPDGSHLREYKLLPMFHVHEPDRGPRQNGSFEALALSPDGDRIFIVTELPLFQDGPPPQVVETRSPLRLTHMDRSGAHLAQYAYELEKVAFSPDPPGATKVNGLVEILTIDDSRLLAVERSYSAGVGSTIKLFEIDIEGATDVSSVASLVHADYVTVGKKELLDFAELGLDAVDNIEAAAWGPTLANGHRSLLFVSDNNFNPDQVTQFVALEVIP